MGLVEEETVTSPTTNALTPEIKEQHHTSYVSIEGTEVNILVQSSRSLVLTSTSQFLRCTSAPQAEFVAAKAVNGPMPDTLGTITATLNSGNHSWQHVLHVLWGSTQTAWLGLDFLVPNRALLDYAHGVLQLLNTDFPLLCGKNFILERCCHSETSQCHPSVRYWCRFVWNHPDPWTNPLTSWAI